MDRSATAEGAVLANVGGAVQANVGGAVLANVEDATQISDSIVVADTDNVSAAISSSGASGGNNNRPTRRPKKKTSAEMEGVIKDVDDSWTQVGKRGLLKKISKEAGNMGRNSQDSLIENWFADDRAVLCKLNSRVLKILCKSRGLSSSTITSVMIDQLVGNDMIGSMNVSSNLAAGERNKMHFKAEEMLRMLLAAGDDSMVSHIEKIQKNKRRAEIATNISDAEWLRINAAWVAITKLFLSTDFVPNNVLEDVIAKSGWVDSFAADGDYNGHTAEHAQDMLNELDPKTSKWTVDDWAKLTSKVVKKRTCEVRDEFLKAVRVAKAVAAMSRDTGQNTPGCWWRFTQGKKVGGLGAETVRVCYAMMYLISDTDHLIKAVDGTNIDHSDFAGRDDEDADDVDDTSDSASLPVQKRRRTSNVSVPSDANSVTSAAALAVREQQQNQQISQQIANAHNSALMATIQESNAKIQESNAKIQESMHEMNTMLRLFLERQMASGTGS